MTLHREESVPLHDLSSWKPDEAVAVTAAHDLALSDAGPSGSSLTGLQAVIKRFLEEHNAAPKPFIWTADPDGIIAAVRRGRQALELIY